METNERAWLEAVAERLGEPTAEPVDDETVRLLLRVTKIAADSTGVRYLAPLTSYLIGRAAGRAGEGFDVRAAVEQISALAESWPRPATPAG
jgi:hypothetical protein